MTKSRRDGWFLPSISEGGCKRRDPVIPTARILLMEMKGGSG